MTGPGHRNWRDPPLLHALPDLYPNRFDLNFVISQTGTTRSQLLSFFELLTLIYDTEPIVRYYRSRWCRVVLPLNEARSLIGVKVAAAFLNITWEPYPRI